MPKASPSADVLQRFGLGLTEPLAVRHEIMVAIRCGKIISGVALWVHDISGQRLGDAQDHDFMTFIKRFHLVSRQGASTAPEKSAMAALDSAKIQPNVQCMLGPISYMMIDTISCQAVQRPSKKWKMLRGKLSLSWDQQTSQCQKGVEDMRLAAAVFRLCALMLMAAFIVLPAQAWAKSPINKNWRGLALQGYDPVAYFTLNKPVKGKKAFEYKWRDATWRFANEKHLKRFKSDPGKYAPQYGGY